jgi:hypothetical protein
MIAAIASSALEHFGVSRLLPEIQAIRGTH